MKICLLCDLHLPRIMSALQYDALRWAVADAKRRGVGCVLVAGDITCDGTLIVYSNFVKQIEREFDVPVLYIPGNSDLRNPETAAKIKKTASPTVTEIGGVTVFALNDCDRHIAEDDLALLLRADKDSIVFMHHPIRSHDGQTRACLEQFVASHPDTPLFYAHRHVSEVKGNLISLQALDPDKAIGEPPCVTYYDTESRKIEKVHYFAPVTADFYNALGISCYHPIADIPFATERHLSAIELRPNAWREDRATLKALIRAWRASGGRDLCVHLPDVGYENGQVTAPDHYLPLLALAHEIGADRVTQHVPLLSVAAADAHPEALDRIASFVADAVERTGGARVIGIENMHMTAKDDANGDRRFGYTPEECLHFMNLVASHTHLEVGINLDLGHARNNAPFSQTYQVGTWLSMLGQYVVGYHFHQVQKGENGFENHMPVTSLHGGIINYTSFFKHWIRNSIRHVPVILEMRPKHAYEISLATLGEEVRSVSDLHTHTYYSRCGRDEPQVLVEAALAGGISVLGITDHAHGIGERLDEYLWEMDRLAERYRDRIKILCGIEIATAPHRYDDRLPEALGAFDYCLIEHLTNEDSCVGRNFLDYCKRVPIPCGIAHTDMFRFCEMYGFDPETYFRQLAELGIFWEINVRCDQTHGYRRNVYVQELMQDEEKLAIVKASGLSLSLASDCHRANEYDAYALYQAHAFFTQHGIPIVDVPRK